MAILGISMILLGAVILLISRLERGNHEPTEPGDQPAPVAADDSPAPRPHVTFTSDRPGTSTGAIEGRVVDADHVGIGGARVWTARGSTRTDAAGLFRLENLHPDVYAVSARAPGLLTVNVGAPVRAGQTTHLTNDIVLAKPGPPPPPPRPKYPQAIVGTVRDPEGRPASGAWVFVGSTLSVVTDAEGAFRLPTPAMTLKVWATGEGMLMSRLDGVVVPEGGEVRVELRLVPGESISGRVLDAAGTPVAGARVSVWQDRGIDGRPDVPGNLPFWTRTTEADGAFEVGGLLPDYPITITAEADRHGRYRVTKVASGTKDLTLLSPRAGAIEGRVLLDGKGAGITLTLTVQGAEVGFGHWKSADPETGAFSFEGIPVGPTRVELWHEDLGFGGTHIVIVKPGSTTQTGVLDFKPTGGEFSATIAFRGFDGRVNRTVQIHGPTWAEMRVEDGGRISTHGLLPGPYCVWPFETNRVLTWFRYPLEAPLDLVVEQTTRFKARIELFDSTGRPRKNLPYLHVTPRGLWTGNTGGDVELDDGRHAFVLPDWRKTDPYATPPVALADVPGGKQSLAIVEREPRARLVVSLPSPLPQPFAAAGVSLVPTHRLDAVYPIPRGSVIAGEDGRFVIDDVPQGPHTLFLRERSFHDHVALGTIDITRGGTIEMDIEMPSGALRGQVVDGDSGRPLPWAEVLLHRVAADGSTDILTGRPVWAAVTADRDGCLLVPCLAPGKYVPFVSAPDHALAYLDPIEVGADGETPITLACPRGVRVTLDCLRADGAPIGGRLAITDAQGRPVHDRRIGDFWFHTREVYRLEPGRYSVACEADGHALLERRIDVARDGESFEFHFTAQSVARVLVRDRDGPVMNAVVGVVLPSGLAPSTWIRRDNDTWNRTNTSGRVTLESLPSGKTRFTARAPDGRRGETTTDVPAASLVDVEIRLD
jgi:Carboxypeptidase regulatory-like domain